MKNILLVLMLIFHSSRGQNSTLKGDKKTDNRDPKTPSKTSTQMQSITTSMAQFNTTSMANNNLTTITNGINGTIHYFISTTKSSGQVIDSSSGKHWSSTRGPGGNNESLVTSPLLKTSPINTFQTKTVESESTTYNDVSSSVILPSISSSIASTPPATVKKVLDQSSITPSQTVLTYSSVISPGETSPSLHGKQTSKKENDSTVSTEIKTTSSIVFIHESVSTATKTAVTPITTAAATTIAGARTKLATAATTAIQGATTTRATTKLATTATARIESATTTATGATTAAASTTIEAATTTTTTAAGATTIEATTTTAAGATAKIEPTTTTVEPAASSSTNMKGETNSTASFGLVTNSSPKNTAVTSPPSSSSSQGKLSSTPSKGSLNSQKMQPSHSTTKIISMATTSTQMMGSAEMTSSIIASTMMTSHPVASHRITSSIKSDSIATKTMTSSKSSRQPSDTMATKMKSSVVPSISVISYSRNAATTASGIVTPWPSNTSEVVLGTSQWSSKATPKPSKTESMSSSTSGPIGNCSCSGWKYPANCKMMCCAGGQISATPICMIASVSVSHQSCNRKPQGMSCGNVSECACKGTQLFSFSYLAVTMLVLAMWLT